MKPVSGQATPVEVAGLIDGARRGEPTAFRELFRLHVGRVHRVVYRLVGGIADLDDVVQTVFVEAFRSLPGFRGESLFSTWLARIAVRVTLRAVKRPAAPSVSIDAVAAVLSDGSTPDDVARANEGARHLDSLLAALKPKKRAAFVLHALEGYSIEETAAVVGASVAATKVRIHDARRELERRARKDAWFAERLKERP
jgi:RNA polymerase sigma-70 factor (ECF subfamily)